MANSPERYFDHAATTPLDPRVLKAMLPFLREQFGNANSLHSWGSAAQAAVEKAREQVAALLGCEDPQELVFTSGATEANNWLLSRPETRLRDGTALAARWISPFEHSSIWELRGEAGEVRVLDHVGWRLSKPSDGAALVSVMAVNNETGTCFVPGELAGSWNLHSDITQALGKHPIDLERLDYASMSAHKLYGPKGVGALYAKDANFPEPLLRGGEQEFDLRAGTLNLPGIVGFGEACALALAEWEERLEHVTQVRHALLGELETVPDWQANGGPDVSPYILSLSFADIQGETLVLEADAAGFGISAGAACSSRSNEPSHVLAALGLEERMLRGTVRVSFGPSNTLESAAELGKLLSKQVQSLRFLRTL